MTVRRLDALLLVLFCVLALGGTALVLVAKEREALDDPVQKGERGEVVGADGLSLVAPANFGRALQAARAELEPDHQLTNLRLTPTQLDVYVRNTVGEQRYIRVGLDYDASSRDAGASSGTGPRGLAGIDAAAPARALAAVLERERWAPATLNYIAYNQPQPGTPGRWDLYFVKVPIERNHVTADAGGRLQES